MPDSPATPPALKRQLGLLDATMINVGTIIASAIFFVPTSIAQQLPASGPAILVWVAGGVVSLLGALCIAELGAARPEEGGQYVYLTEAFGPVWGYLYGWANATVINPASIAAIAVLFATYLGFFIPLTPWGIKGVAVGSILALTMLNCLGVRAGALTQNVLTLLKIGIVAFLIVTGFVLPGGSAQHLAPVGLSGPVTSWISPFGVAMIGVLWAYDGWIEVTYVAGEVRDPGRVIPRAILVSTAIAVTLYVLVSASYLWVLSPARVAASSLVASDAAAVTLGAAGAGVVAVAIMISTLGANNGIVLTGARIPFAMARDGRFFRWQASVSPRFLTPVAALIFQCAVTVVLTLTGSYDRLFTYVVFASFLFYALSCAAVMRLRRLAPELPRPYRTWGYPVTPVIFIVFAIWLVYNTIHEKPVDSLVGVGIILTGLPGYFWWTRAGAVRGAPEGQA
jgi:APA family basic amino acid/polyamine antiporter